MVQGKDRDRIFSADRGRALGGGHVLRPMGKISADRRKMRAARLVCQGNAALTAGGQTLVLGLPKAKDGEDGSHYQSIR